jgi:electron transfer flavoprotein alpha subunit
MAVLLLAEHDNRRLDPQTARALAAALAIGGPVHVLIAGSECNAVAESAARLAGVERVLVADDTRFSAMPAEAVGQLIVELAGDYRAILAAATSTGKDILPGVAARLDVMQISDIISVEDPSTFRRPVYAGNAVEVVRSNERPLVLTVRASAFAPHGRGDGMAEILRIPVPDIPTLTRFVEDRNAISDRPALTSARIVVAGGRGFGSKERFDALLAPLAERLGAAIGASRAAVDAGYASNEMQVGQTGKVVAPDLYIACGISGAVQHLAGITGAKVIVAINSDPAAPIFGIADYGLVGDIIELLPQLTAAVDV